MVASPSELVETVERGNTSYAVLGPRDSNGPQIKVFLPPVGVIPASGITTATATSHASLPSASAQAAPSSTAIQLPPLGRCISTIPCEEIVTPRDDPASSLNPSA